MRLYLLDTDTLTLFQHGHPIVTRRCAARPPGELATTVISLEELISGWYTMLRQAKRPDQLALAYQSLIDSIQFVTRMPILPFTFPTIARFQHLAGLKLNVRRMDLRIAATVLEVGATLVTRNRRDFGRIPGLLLEDWSV
jgi:tRNA(fMet)-specific endonuclease VapC